MNIKERVENVKNRFPGDGEFDEIPLHRKDFQLIIEELERLWRIEECANRLVELEKHSEEIGENYDYYRSEAYYKEQEKLRKEFEEALEAAKVK